MTNTHLGFALLILLTTAPASAFADEYDVPGTFKGYPCTQDCSGHRAGYEWAEDKNITDESECGGSSNSFIEGCRSWVEENTDEDESESADDEHLQ